MGWKMRKDKLDSDHSDFEAPTDQVQEQDYDMEADAAAVARLAQMSANDDTQSFSLNLDDPTYKPDTNKRATLDPSAFSWFAESSSNGHPAAAAGNNGPESTPRQSPVINGQFDTKPQSVGSRVEINGTFGTAPAPSWAQEPSPFTEPTVPPAPPSSSVSNGRSAFATPPTSDDQQEPTWASPAQDPTWSQPATAIDPEPQSPPANSGRSPFAPPPVWDQPEPTWTSPAQDLSWSQPAPTAEPEPQAPV